MSNTSQLKSSSDLNKQQPIVSPIHKVSDGEPKLSSSQVLLRDSSPYLLYDSTNPVIVDLQHHIRLLQSERDRLRTENALKDKEIQSLKDRLAEAMNLKYINYDSQTVKLLTEENTKLRLALKELDDQHRIKDVAILEVASDKDRHEAEKKSAINQNVDLQSRCRALVEENQRISAALLAKTKDFDDLTVKARVLAQDNAALSEALAAARRDNEVLTARLAELQKVAAENEALRNRIVLITQENERISRLYQERLAENEALRRRVAELEAALGAANNTIDQLNLRVKVQAEDIDRLKAALGAAHQEIDQLRQRVAELTPLISENEALRNRIVLITQENERITRLYQERLAENEALRRRIAELEAALGQANNTIDQLNLRIKVLSEDIERLKAALAAAHQEIDQLRQRVAELTPLISENEALRNRIVLITQENERITRLYQERLAENEALRRRIAELEAALGQANSTIEQQALRIKVLMEDIERLKEALSNRNQENDALRRRVDELSPLVAEVEALRNRIVLITQENERITRLYQERLQEIDALRRRIAELEAALSAANSTIEQLQLRLKVLSEDIQRLKDALASQVAENDKLRARVAELTPLISEVEALRNRIVLITQENERITRLYQERLLEIEALRKHCADYDNLKRLYNACVDENNRLQGVINDRVQEIQRLYQKLHEHHAQEATHAGQLYDNLRNSTNFQPFHKVE